MVSDHNQRIVHLSSGLKSNGCKAANAAEPAPTLLTRFPAFANSVVQLVILLLI